MFIVEAPVEGIIELENQIVLLKAQCPEIARKINPGEFVNIRVSETIFPLLRRPFSICDVDGDSIFLMFNILGEGTKILAHKKMGATIDILGPLGHGFDLEGDYETAVIVGGGLGASPFPYLQRRLDPSKKVLSFVGGRTKKDIIDYRMQNLSVSTDDGSMGMKGNVVDLLKSKLDELKQTKIKIFACGPNAMLRALKTFTMENNFECETSTECAMACGFGICQGCPIQSAKDPDKYFLVCKDGPVFKAEDVVI